MDSLTQAALGAVMGELVLGRKLGWRGAAWGAFFGTLPDLDVIALPFLDAAAGIRWHRGLSHSILIMIMASLILARPVARCHRERGVKAVEAGWLIFWAWSTHVLIDCFTTYGTQIFEPFSDARVAMNVMFIVDPLFTLPLLIGLWMALRLPRDSWRRRRVMGISVCVSSLYVMVGFAMQSWAENEISRHMKNDLLDAELVQVAPSSFNTILWRGLIETKEGYYLTYWSPFDGEQGAAYDYIEKKCEIMNSYEGTAELDALKWFSRRHWVARKGKDGRSVFIDMRFTEIRDPRSGILQPIFQWHLERAESGSVSVPMERPTGLDYAGAGVLIWERIWGGQERWEAVKEF